MYPQAAARAAIIAAARHHIPGLASGIGNVPTTGAGSNRGRWIHRGNKIIIFGV